MKLSEMKQILTTLHELNFQLEDGTYVPAHAHITEIGMIHKQFIDCGGTIRQEKKINFQLWNADDYDHRLLPSKLLNIIKLSEESIVIEDCEIEVEYQNNTIGKYGLSFDGKNFILTNQLTACLASDQCGIPEKKKVKLSELKTNVKSCCSPDSGCC